MFEPAWRDIDVWRSTRGDRRLWFSNDGQPACGTTAGKLAHGLSIPPFIIGVTFFAVGTDIPEIANSVMASLAGHGDLNVGDSIGSVVTQITLVLGLFPFLGGRFVVGRYRAVATSSLTIAALLIGAFLVADGV